MANTAFVSGTKKFFQQASAPTGWTIDTTNTDYTVRIVSGATGGTLNNSLDYSTTMADNLSFPGTVSGFNATVDGIMADLPAHTHTYTNTLNSSATTPTTYNPGGVTAVTSTGPASPTNYYGLAGGGNPHTHTLTGTLSSTCTGTGNFAVKYVDFILASKN